MSEAGISGIVATGFCWFPGRSRTPACERGRSEGDGWRGCGVLRDEVEWGLECESEADSWMEATTPGMAAVEVTRPSRVFTHLVKAFEAFVFGPCTLVRTWGTHSDRGWVDRRLRSERSIFCTSIYRLRNSC